ETDRLARGLPGFPEVPNGPPLAVEDVGAVEPPGLQPAGNHGCQFADQRQHATVLVLGVRGPQPDGLLSAVVVPSTRAFAPRPRAMPTRRGKTPRRRGRRRGAGTVPRLVPG